MMVSIDRAGAGGSSIVLLLPVRKKNPQKIENGRILDSTDRLLDSTERQTHKIPASPTRVRECTLCENLLCGLPKLWE